MVLATGLGVGHLPDSAASSRAESRKASLVTYFRDGTLRTLRLELDRDAKKLAVDQKTICSVPTDDVLSRVTVSADGKWLAFDRLSNGNWPPAVWLVRNQSGANPRKLLRGQNPQFAPSGLRLLYTHWPKEDSDRWSQEVRCFDVASVKSTTVLPHAHNASWSRDGREIALIDESKFEFEGTVRVLVLEGARRKAFGRESINVWSPLLSPNGRYVAYNPHLSRPKVPGQIADRETGEEYCLPHAGEPVLDWSPDSKWLLWTRYVIDPANDGAWRWREVWMSSWNGTRSRRIGYGTAARFTPDGRGILFVRMGRVRRAETGDLCYSDLAGRRVHVLARNVAEPFDVQTIRATGGDRENQLAVQKSNSKVQSQMPAADKPGWNLTFRDEFDGARLDTKKWIDSYPDGKRTHSNNEQQYYATDGYDLKGGFLRFKAHRRSMGGMPYTSGMISSFGKFSQKYGFFEIRARFPKGKGLWPAFWLLPVTKRWPPEIDVLEILGHDTNKVYFSTHYSSRAKRHEFKTGFWVGPDFSKDFHTFAVEWSPGLCIWYVDGVERYRHTDGVPEEPMYILANLAVGGDWPGMPDTTTPFPSYMEIDYIRVYERKLGENTDLPPPPPVFKKP